MKDSTVTNGPGPDTRYGRDDDTFKELLNARIDQRERHHDMSEAELNRIFNLALQLRRAEPDSEEHRDLIHNLRRADRFRAIADSFKEFLDFVTKGQPDENNHDDDYSEEGDEPEDKGKADRVEEAQTNPATSRHLSLKDRLALAAGADDTIRPASEDAKASSVGERAVGEKVEAEETPEIPAKAPTPQIAGRAAADSMTRRTVEPVSTRAPTPSIRTMMASSGGDTDDTSSRPTPEAPPLGGADVDDKAQAKGQKKKKSVNGTGPESRTSDNCAPPKAQPVKQFNASTVESPEGSEYWATRINQQLKNSVEALITAGKDLVEAKARLRHGEWTRMFDGGLVGIGLREAQKLMQIAGHSGLTKATNWAHLPPSQHALTALSRIPAADLAVAIKERKISAATTIQEAEEIAKGVLGETKDSAERQTPAFDVGKAVARCLKTISQTVAAADEQHRKVFVEKLSTELSKLQVMKHAV